MTKTNLLMRCWPFVARRPVLAALRRQSAPAHSPEAAMWQSWHIQHPVKTKTMSALTMSAFHEEEEGIEEEEKEQDEGKTQKEKQE